jgi:hypothetical protein
MSMAGDAELEARGFWLYPSVAFHSYLTGAFIVPALVLVPFFFLTYVSALTGLLAIPMGFVGGALAMPLAGLMHVRRGPRFRMLVGQDNMLFGLGIACLILSLLGVINPALEWIGCGASETESSFPSYIFNQTCPELNSTIAIGNQPQYRRPFFAFMLGWYQGCIDDYPVVILLMVIFAWFVVHCCILIGYAYRMRRDSPGM